jgi:hypothetical protein
MYFTFKYIQIHSKNYGDVILKIRDADRLGGQRSQVPPDRERVENRSTGYLAQFRTSIRDDLFFIYAVV